ncbi:Signal recognition particle 9 kDa protein [Fasciola hepatica]|uniref:Signal recognition particle 9 kDa protein n=1 Tax=Fasciola hepatica TaxID=6192 RepID=A0A4E0R985_FASHE|nr:Signal recognition particle 9 kDa protein [Fasciola hepatica]
MTNFSSFEEFSKAAEVLYLVDPMKVISVCLFYLLQCRVCTKYRHIDKKLSIKVTDNQIVLKYVTDLAQDVKKIEKFTTLIMRHMASKEK